MKKRIWKFMLFLPFGSLALTACNESKEKQLIVRKVYDGDTVYLNDGTIKGRIFAIDAPEIKDQFWNLTTGKRYRAALLSKNKLSDLLSTKKLKVTKITIDNYGRYIIKITKNNEDIGLKMVHLGMAKVAYISHKKSNKFFSKDEFYYKQLLDAQHYAYTNKLGIWSQEGLYKQIFPKV